MPNLHRTEVENYVGLLISPHFTVPRTLVIGDDRVGKKSCFFKKTIFFIFYFLIFNIVFEPLFLSGFFSIYKNGSTAF